MTVFSWTQDDTGHIALMGGVFVGRVQRIAIEPDEEGDGSTAVFDVVPCFGSLEKLSAVEGLDEAKGILERSIAKTVVKLVESKRECLPWPETGS